MTTRLGYASMRNWLLLNHHKSGLMRLENFDLQKNKNKK
jgi:hypothetical protein